MRGGRRGFFLVKANVYVLGDAPWGLVSLLMSLLRTQPLGQKAFAPGVSALHTQKPPILEHIFKCNNHLPPPGGSSASPERKEKLWGKLPLCLRGSDVEYVRIYAIFRVFVPNL